MLIVDDNMFSNLALRTVLQQYEFESDVASGGNEAVQCVIKRFEKFNTTYDLIFMDLTMPICNGYQASEQIRAFLDNNVPIDMKKPYICLLTSLSKENRSDHRIHGVNESITKPIFKVGVRKILLRSGLLKNYWLSFFKTNFNLNILIN